MLPGAGRIKLFLLAPHAAAEPEAEDEDGEEEDAEGGAEGLVAGGGELFLDDLTDRRVGPAAHQRGDGEHGDGGNKNEQDAGGDAGLGQGQDDLLDTLLADKGKVGYLLPDRPLLPVQGRKSHDYRRNFRDDRDRRRRKGHNIQADPDHQVQVRMDIHEPECFGL